MKTIRQTLSTAALVLCVGSAHAGPKEPTATVRSTAVLRQSVTVLLREPTTGNQLGSGVLVGRTSGGYWLVTNRHVVEQNKLVCVVSADRKARAALVLPATQSKSSQALDLALLWLPGASKELLRVAATATQQVDARQLPQVSATGYPTPLQPRPNGAPYTETEGLLLPLLNAPLGGGFDLAYTAMVQKGMSGGGIFIGSELIGINGAHANPLWPGQWRDQRGNLVDAPLNSKLELVSLGISANAIKAELKAAAVPGAAQLNSLSGVDCNTERQQKADHSSVKRF